MEFLRSCYSSKWRFPETGTADVPGYFYFCPEDTPHYDQWHYFGSRNWHHNDGSPIPVFGERENVRQSWRDGSFPVPRPDPIRVGLQGCIDGTGLNPDADDRPSSLVLGVDVRCWVSRPVPHFLAGAEALDLMATAELAAGFGISGSESIDLVATADLVAGRALTDEELVDLVATAVLLRSVSIAGRDVVDLVATAVLVAGRQIAGAEALKLTASSTLNPNFRESGSETLKLTASSTLNPKFSEAGSSSLYVAPSVSRSASMTACSKCPGGMFIQWRLNVAGGTGNNSSFNGNWILRWTTGCTFALTSSPNTFTLTFNLGPNTWTVTMVNATNTLVYTIAGASWACSGANSLTFTSQVGTGTHAASVGLVSG